MYNVSAIPAGQLIDAEVDDRGTLTLKAMIDNQVAAMNCAELVYPGASISFSDTSGRVEVENISLVDRPFEKALGGSYKVLVKVFNRKDEVMQQHPVLVELEAATQMVADMAKRSYGDRHIAEIRLKRAQDATMVEYIKATRTPAHAPGDRNFIQWRLDR